jgi:hypothetical protein
MAAEAGTVARAGAAAGLVVSAAMGYYFIIVLRPVSVLPPPYNMPLLDALTPIALVLVTTVPATIAGSHLVNRLEPTELLGDEWVSVN